MNSDRERNRQRMRQLLDKPGNGNCGDCGAAGRSAASPRQTQDPFLPSRSYFTACVSTLSPYSSITHHQLYKVIWRGTPNSPLREFQVGCDSEQLIYWPEWRTGDFLATLFFFKRSLTLFFLGIFFTFVLYEGPNIPSTRGRTHRWSHLLFRFEICSSVCDKQAEKSSVFCWN